MGIETIVATRKGKEGLQLPSETISKSSSKRNRRGRQRKMSVVQRLYDTCSEVFVAGRHGIVPPEGDIQRIKSVLDEMRGVDVGLNPNMPYFRRAATDQLPKITYLHIHECDKFSIGIFCLPPSGVIPLHNHPGMTVFSKLLFGTIHIKSYDWAVDISPDPNAPPGLRLAKVKVDSDFTAPCNTSVLYPADGGNMHCFTAVTPCAVLDVLCPPYSDPDGRHCAYYLDFPFSTFSVDGAPAPDEGRESYGWLQEREDLEDLTVVGAPYNGPRIVKR